MAEEKKIVKGRLVVTWYPEGGVEESRTLFEANSVPQADAEHIGKSLQDAKFKEWEKPVK